MKEGTGTILIVEDEEHDVEFLRRALHRAGVANPVQCVSNGEQAIAYLSGDGEYADRTRYPVPVVMVTDLKMPQMGGLELLRWVKSNPKYRVIPTIVLTSSTSEADVLDAYTHGVSGYFVKPVRFGDLEDVAKSIADYWRRAIIPSTRR